jgi:hypothetical protein
MDAYFAYLAWQEVELSAHHSVELSVALWAVPSLTLSLLKVSFESTGRV